MATALNALSVIKVIHADIKLNNIMLVNRLRPFRVKLIDFGLAKYCPKPSKDLVNPFYYYR